MSLGRGFLQQDMLHKMGKHEEHSPQLYSQRLKIHDVTELSRVDTNQRVVGNISATRQQSFTEQKQFAIRKHDRSSVKSKDWPTEIPQEQLSLSEKIYIEKYLLKNKKNRFVKYNSQSL